MSLPFACSVAVAALLALPALSPAAITFYTDRAAWLAAANGTAGVTVSTENFNGFADTYPSDAVPNFSVGPVNFANNDVGFTGSNGVLSGALVNGFGLVFFRSQAVTGSPLIGFGFDHPGPFTGALDFTLYADNFAFGGVRTEGSTFVGFLANAADVGSSVNFEASTNGLYDFASFDNMVVAAVPEPAALAAAALSAGLLLRRRRA